MALPGPRFRARGLQAVRESYLFFYTTQYVSAALHLGSPRKLIQQRKMANVHPQTHGECCIRSLTQLCSQEQNLGNILHSPPQEHDE